MLKAAMLGYGGIARAHRRGYEILAQQENSPVQLVALCDIDPNQFEKDIARGRTMPYRTYTDLEEMLSREELDIIDICLPSYLHSEYAVKLLRRGYNVQCEKPMGLNAEECEAMLQAARESGKKLMIGMCLRFDPSYLALKKIIDEGTYGKVTSAFFQRLSSIPVGSYKDWFLDYKLSGGVSLDLHIHDVDMIRFLFGEPESVCSSTVDVIGKCTTIHSQFRYPDKIVTAIADWARSNSYPFYCSCKLNLETASVDMNTSDGITVYPQNAKPFRLEYGSENYFAQEIGFFARTVLGEAENTFNTPESAEATVKLIDRLMESAENGGRTVFLP